MKTNIKFRNQIHVTHVIFKCLFERNEILLQLLYGLLNSDGICCIEIIHFNLFMKHLFLLIYCKLSLFQVGIDTL